MFTAHIIKADVIFPVFAEITLFDELEACRLYVQPESMRFADKFNYRFNIDGTLDLKSIMVSALIVQPLLKMQSGMVLCLKKWWKYDCYCY